MTDLAARIAALSPEKQALLQARIRERGLDLPASGGIPRLAQAESYALSLAQERLWVDGTLGAAPERYNESRVFRLAGPLAAGALARSLDAILARHEVLRSRIDARDGTPTQRVDAPRPLALPVEDLRDLPAGAREEAVATVSRAEAARPFDLAAEWPFRARLLRLADDEHRLIVTMHHIVCDAGSHRVFISEAATLYEALAAGREAPLPPLPIQYRDFADWQRRLVPDAVLRARVAHWAERLEGAESAARLPHDHERPAEPSFHGARRHFAIPAPVAAALRQLARDTGATPFVVHLAALKALLARYTAQDDIVVGTLHADRDRDELRLLIGFFVDTLVLRTDLSGDPTLREVVARVRDTTFEAYANRELPYDRLVKALRPKRAAQGSPLFQIEFLYEAGGVREVEVAGLGISSVETHNGRAKFDLLVDLREGPEGIDGFLEYSTEVFADVTMARFAAHLAALLHALALSADTRVSDLPLVTDDDRALLDAWNATERHDPPACLHRLIEAQADATPEAEAVAWEGGAITYRTLDRRANRLAHHLRAQGIGPEARVGIALERSEELVVALLAVLKAGAAYVPLDPGYPDDRLAAMLAVAPLAALVTSAGNRLAARDGLVVLLDADAALVAARPTHRPKDDADPDTLAYAIFTSGSTGVPKGVMISHRAVVNHMRWMQAEYGLGPADRFLHKTPISFDVSAFELFWPLMTGATLVLAAPDRHRDPAYLADLIRAQGITAVYFVASMLRAFLEAEGVEACTSLRLLFSGGEALPVRTHDRVFERLPAIALHNLYGPTEATIDVTAWPCRRDRSHARVPIGRPVHNTRIHILDRRMRPVPVGAVGHLYIGGAHLGRGYLLRPDLTAAAFVPDPFSNVPGARLYRSGDLARHLHDGAIEYLGRADEQVKIRGNRIELGDVEHALRAHADVRDAVVVTRDDERGEARLAAYVVLERAEADLAEVWTELRRRLPDAAMPSWLTPIASVPTAPNGKIDRRALPAPRQSPATRPPAPEPDPLERTLLGIWEQVLGATGLRVDDNYFEVGGDSMLAIQIVARAGQAGIRLRLADMFAHQTVRELAGAAAFAAPVPEQPAVISAGLTPAQARFFERDPEGTGRFSLALAVSLPERTDAGHLAAALAAVWRHHEALRTRFARTGEGWRQHAGAPDDPPVLDVARLDGLAEPERAAALAAEIEAAHGRISLAGGRLFAARLLDLGGEGMRLLLAAHHLVIDVVSWRILVEDIETAYAQCAAGSPPDLPRPGCSFLAWARLLEAYGARALENDLPYWTARPAVPLPLPTAGRSGPSRIRARNLALSAAETDILVRRFPARTGATVQEILIAALMQALARIAKADAVSVMVEGHGRESAVADADVSRTVGWFTQHVPLTCPVSPEGGCGEVLRSVRRELRAVPGRGIGYGVLRHLTQEGARALGAAPEPEIAFNYLGRVESARAGAPFAPILDDPGAMQAPGAVRPFPIEVEALVLDGRLGIRIGYDAALHEETVIESLAEAIGTALGELGREDDAASPAVVPAADSEITDEEAEDAYPLSPTQQGFLFHTLLEPDSGVYVQQLHCRLEGELDPAAFEQAWRAAIARHPVLRTRFDWERDADRPVQVVLRRAELACAWEDLRDLPPEAQAHRFADHLARDRRRGFDLATLPLLRLAVFRTDERAHRLVWTHHHVILDGFSMPVVLGEVFALYEAAVEGRDAALPEAAPYRSFIRWLDRQDHAGAEAFWRAELSGVAGPTRLRMPRPARASRCGTRRMALDEAETAILQDCARRNRLTLNTLVQGAWAIVVSRYSGEADVLFGATGAGRHANLPGAERIVGPCVNTLPVRIAVPAREPVLSWLRAHQDRQVAAKAFDFTPLPRISEWLGLPPGRDLFESVLVFENYPMGEVLGAARGALRLRDPEAVEQTSYPLTLLAIPGARLEFALLFDGAAHDDASAGVLLSAMRCALSGLAAGMAGPVENVPLLDDAGRRDALSRARGPLDGLCGSDLLHRRFEAHAAAAPGAIAVTCGGEALSYGALDARAGALAARLRALGIGRGSFVGLYLSRSPAMIVAMIAVLKAGGAYVPVDPQAPPERLDAILRDSAVPVMVTQAALADRLRGNGPQVLRLDEPAPAADGSPPAPPARPDDAAYVMYTSGSTGRPKGVVVTHANAAAHFAPAAGLYGFRPDDVWTMFHSYGFDFSVWEMWGALSHGCRLVLVPEETARAPADFHELLVREGVSVLTQTPSYFAQLAAHVLEGPDTGASRLRLLFLGGEPLRFGDLLPWFARHGDERPRVVNVYGPTEATVAVTHRPITARCAREISGSLLGRPLGGNRVHVLDGLMRPVPPGMIGDIHVGGSGVGRGYLAQARLTAERFGPDPFGEAGARLYRTGDRGRWTLDGEIEFLGRIDHQVKIRGFRLELEEIEVALRAHPDVREAAAAVSRTDDQRLVAYLVPAPGAAMHEPALRAFLRRRLPDYMIPHVFVAMEALPLSASGKLDRGALPDPPSQRQAAARPPAPPTTERERLLATLWSTVLGVDEIGIDDDFFELGGDSIRSIRLAALARRHGLALSLAELFARPTIRELARLRPEEPPGPAIEEGRPFAMIGEGRRAALPAGIEDAFPASRLQLGMLFHAEEGTGEGLYHNVLGLRLEADLDEGVLREALRDVADAHPALRTGFDLSGADGPLQVVHRCVPLPLRVEDWRGMAPEARAARVSARIEEARAFRFDTARAPLFRLDVLREDERTAWLVLVTHHAILDGWSIATLLTDLFAHYAARMGTGAPVPPPTRLAGMPAFLRLERAAEDSPGTRAFWQRQLAGAEAPRLPRHASTSLHARSERALPERLRADLRRAAAAGGVPLRTVFLGAHLAALCLLTGSRDVLTGLVTNGRPEREDGDRVLGLFLNTLPCRLRLPEAGWDTLLRQVLAAETAILPHRWLPLSEILRPTGLRLETSFNFVDFHVYDRLRAGSDVEVLAVDADERTEFAIEVGVMPDALAVNTRGLPDGWAERIADHVLHALRLIAADIRAPFVPESLLPEEERRALLALSAGALTDAPCPDVVAAFSAWARRTPHAPAVLDGETALSYARLDTRSDGLARRLRAEGVGPGDLVALACDRSAAAVAAILAVLKAGAAYLPLDPDQPPERLAGLLAQARPRAVLRGGSWAPPVPAAGVPVIHLDKEDDDARTGPLPAAGSPDDLAYVMYTSGSTGTPKGVMATRRGLAAVTRFHVAAFGTGPGSRVLHFASLGFDSSVPEIFGTLCSGAAIRIVPPHERAGDALVAFMEGAGITHATLPPSVLASAAPSALPALVLVGSAGEACPPEIVRRWGGSRRFLNLYGPTEATVDAIFAECVPDGEAPPLGRPVPGARVYLLGPDLHRVPRNAVGEIWLGGPQLARGYLGAPDLTADRFRPDPWSGEPGARLYRTGDLGRYRDDGQLEWVGRLDDQVKLHGRRVEPGEVEHALTRHPSVRACAAVAVAGPAGPALVAYAVCDGAAADGDGLRAWLAGTLPRFLLPAAVVTLDALPLTPNGKVDRAALARSGLPAGRHPPVAPRTALEASLAAIWAEVLKIPRIGVEDDVFAAGADSLAVLQVAARIRAGLGTDLPVRALFEAPSVAALAGRIARDGGGRHVPPLAARPATEPPVLSPEQERAWILHRLDPGGSTYNVPSAMRLSGALDPGALERALGALMDRHEVLRMTVAVEDGRPAPAIAPAAEPAMGRERLPRAALDGRLRQEASRGFDLERGPLLRATLYETGPEEHVLLLVMHHLVCDGWSTAILARELAALYEAGLRGTEPGLPRLSFQYADYAAWQRRQLATGSLDARIAARVAALRTASPVLDLPADHSRRAHSAPAGGRHVVGIAPRLREALERVGQAERATPFMTLLAAYGVLLARHAGVGEVLIGSPSTTRPLPALEPLIGYFVNTLVVRVATGGTTREVLRGARDAVLDALAHQDVPFERLVEALAPERDLSRPPLAQAAFSMQQAPPALPEAGGLRTEPLDIDFATAKFDLTLSVHEAEGGWRAVLEYDARLFEPRTVAGMAERFLRLLEHMADAPEGRPDALPLLSTAERAALLRDWTAPHPAYPREASLPVLFEAVVDRGPERIALAGAGRTLTYAALDRRANGLARRLREAGVGPGVPVGLPATRSPDLVIALLGILKAGGCYVPVEATLPPERARALVADAGIRVWVEGGDLGGVRPEIAGPGAAVVGLTAEAGADRPPWTARATDPAYIVFTSGSTGRPKGVCVPHRAVARLVLGQDYCRFGPDETLLHLAPASFDAATFEIWGALLHGGRLAVAPPGPLGVEELGAVLRAEGVTTLWLTAGHFHRVVDDGIAILSGLRTLVTGGDVVSPARVSRMREALPGCRLVDGYGPTENTTFTACEVVCEAIPEGAAVPVGRPIAHGRAYVLDQRLEPLPAGVWGELYAAGDGLALGYVADAALTAERFLPDPFAGEPGARMYRTGDAARYAHDGRLELRGRLDGQVKLRGYRVEPGDVEAALRRHPAVRDCAVVARRGADGSEATLVAYVVAGHALNGHALNGEEAPTGPDLRAHAAALLPAYMVPSLFVALDALPLGETGKLDRAALAARPLTQPPPGPGAAPAVGMGDEVEAVLAGIWQDLLGIAEVAPEDDFFALGGHSLRAMQLASRIREALCVEIPLHEVFAASTFGALAARLRALAPVAARVQPEADPSDWAPLTFAQEQLWSFERLTPGTPTYTVPVALRLRGPLDAAALARAVDRVARRHDVLRGAIEPRDGAPVQIVRHDGIDLRRTDLSGLPPAERWPAAARAMEEEARRPFDLATGPLFRADLWRLDAGDHLVLLCLHHIVCDAWSIRVMLDEIGRIYAAPAGREPELPPLRLRYADHARRQRQGAGSDGLARQRAYWRDMLAGAPPSVDLPTDRPRSARADSPGAEVAFPVPAALREAVGTVARAQGCTPYVVWLAGFQTWLSRYTGQDDLLLASPVSRRPGRDLEALVGYFVTVAALRLRTGGGRPFREAVAAARRTTIDALAHQDVPFEQVLDAAAGPGRDRPAPNVMFALQPWAEDDLSLPGLSVEPVASRAETAKFDLALVVAGPPEAPVATLSYRTALFDRGTVEHMGRSLLHFVAAALARPDMRVDDIPLMDEADAAGALRLATQPEATT